MIITAGTFKFCFWPGKNQNLHSPPSSSESDMNVSCIDSGAKTLYFSSTVVVVVVVTTVSVTTFRVSTREM